MISSVCLRPSRRAGRRAASLRSMSRSTRPRWHCPSTLNAVGKAGDPKYGFNDTLPGGQLYRYDPGSGQTELFASLPPRRCTATALLDRARNVWWCNLEAGGGDALWGLDLATRKIVF